MNTDKRTPLITARSFFRQLRSYGYGPNQILPIINELLELVTASVREGKLSPVLVEAMQEEGTPPPPQVR
jgi:hypothetical protein